jgi:hypothetical protein
VDPAVVRSNDDDEEKKYLGFFCFVSSRRMYVDRKVLVRKFFDETMASFILYNNITFNKNHIRIHNTPIEVGLRNKTNLKSNGLSNKDNKTL